MAENNEEGGISDATVSFQDNHNNTQPNLSSNFDSVIKPEL